MEHEWTFKATDIVSGREQNIDQDWPRSDAAKNPDNGYPGNYCEDEHIVQTPAGDYVLVWRADQYRHYHECQRMPERKARDWCERQGIAWPEEFNDAAPMTAGQPPANEPRTLWELGQRIAPALDALCSAIADLFVEYESPFSGADIVFQGVDGEAGSKVRAAAVELHARMPRENDPFREWEIVAPRGTQDFVDVVSGIDAFVKGIVADVAFDRANTDAYWQRALKLAYARCDVLLKAIVQLESLPELHPHVLTEALRKLQAPAPATAAASETAPQAGDFVETPGGDIGFVEWAAYPMPEPAMDEAKRPATEGAAVEAPVAQGVAVGSATESKATVDAADKRLWTKTAAQPIVYAYLKKHPLATAKAIEAETGIPDSTVCKTQAWIRRPHKRRKGKRSRHTRRGIVSLTEKVMAMAKKVAGPDVDVEALIRRCEVEPALRQTIEDAYDADVTNEAQR